MSGKHREWPAAYLESIKRAKAFADEIESTLEAMYTRGVTDDLRTAADFRDFAAMLREWAGEIEKFDPDADGSEEP